MNIQTQTENDAERAKLLREQREEDLVVESIVSGRSLAIAAFSAELYELEYQRNSELLMEAAQ